MSLGPESMSQLYGERYYASSPSSEVETACRHGRELEKEAFTGPCAEGASGERRW